MKERVRVSDGRYRKYIKKHWYSRWKIVEDKWLPTAIDLDPQIKHYDYNSVSIPINSKEDIDYIISLLDNHRKCAAIYIDKHHYLCGVYWSEAECEWKFKFSSMMSYSASDSVLLKWFKTFKQPTFDIRILVERNDLSYIVKQSLLDGILNYPDDNAKTLMREVKESLGRVIKICDMEPEYILVGLTVTEDDFYYVGMTSDFNLHFTSCCAGFDIVPYEKISNEMRNILNRDDLDAIITRVRHNYFNHLWVSEVELVSY